MATVVPDIGPLVSFVGCVGFSILGLIVPVIMEIVWYWYPKDDGGDDDDDENDHPEHWVGGTVPVTGKNDDSTAVVVMAVAAAADITAATTTATGENNGKKQINRRRVAYRIARYIKSAAVLAIAVLALFGGGYYNICDIVNQISSVA